jgi:carbonic anhydrase/acetyltransferase-like protein (isoleucine patch superfamily)
MWPLAEGEMGTREVAAAAATGERQWQVVQRLSPISCIACQYLTSLQQLSHNGDNAMAFIHRKATVLGDVQLGESVSVWPGAVLRGDTDRITIGDESNVQDGAVLHVDPGIPCLIGKRVTIGHRAVVHGATVHDECLVGMGAIILNGAVIGSGSVIGAGAVVREGMQVPPRSLVLGVPGKVVRQVDDEAHVRILRGAAVYVELQKRHAAGEFPERT